MADNPIVKTQTIREVLTVKPDAAPIFAGFGMFCIGCPAAQSETLEEACAAHGVDPEELVNALNG